MIDSPTGGWRPRFDRVRWLPDRALCDGLVFRLEQGKREDWELGEDCLRLYKTRDIICQYEVLFRARPGWRPRAVLELGIWDGGSLAFWYEVLRPMKLVGVDVMARVDSPYLKAWQHRRRCGSRVKSVWGVNQADPAALEAALAAEFPSAPDLIIDDASHQLVETARSFELLFPRLRPGSLYVIEDWSWAHWWDFQPPDHPWAGRPALTDFIHGLVEATGTNRDDQPGPFAQLLLQRDLLAIERGAGPIPDAADGWLERVTLRRGA